MFKINKKIPERRRWPFNFKHVIAAMVLASLKSIFFSVEMYITLTFGLALPLYCSAISTALK